MFIDEIDKVGGDSSWEMFLRSEVFTLLDAKIPAGLQEMGNQDDGARIVSTANLERVQQTLADKTLILAAGAFQHIYDTRSKNSLGFQENPGHAELTDLAHLAATLPRELINRFRSRLIILSPLFETDLRRMINAVAEGIPRYLRATFLKLGEQRIPEAARLSQGCRFIEELLLDVIIAEREEMRTNTSPTPDSTEQVSHFREPTL